MGHRPNLRLTRADRETIARWWRVMFAGVVVVVLALLGAEQAHQKLWPSTPSMQVADESSVTLGKLGF
jgi:hypothetical protein